MQVVTVILGPPPPGADVLAVITPDEPIYRIVRGAVIHRDELNGHRTGEARLTYGDNSQVAVTYRVSKDIHG